MRISRHTNTYDIAIISAYEYVMVLACLRAVSQRLCTDASLGESDPKTCLIATRWIQKMYLHLVRVAVLSSVDVPKTYLLIEMELERVGFKTYSCTHCSSNLKFWTLD